MSISFISVHNILRRILLNFYNNSFHANLKDGWSAKKNFIIIQTLFMSDDSYN